jgi:dolichyl-phosphate beta-glucosyltransferase
VAIFLSVVVPAYNEERRLQLTLEAILTFLAAQPFSSELIVVDDGSTDATVRIAETLREQHPDLRIIRNDHRGKGYTVRTGMLLAQGKYVLFTDADLAVPMEEWAKLAPAFDSGYDIVIGSREGLGARRLGEPRYRHFMGRIFNRVVQLIALGGIQDTQCGFKAFRGEVAQHVFNSVQLYGADAKVVQGAAVTAFDVEALFLARKFGYRIKEVPVTWRYGAETKVDPIRDSWRNFSDVIRVRWNDLRGRYAAMPSLPKKTPSK